MIDVFCSDPTHPNNSAYPGWTDAPLATADRPITGMICAGCALARTSPMPTLAEIKRKRIAEIEARSADLLAAGVTHREVTFSLAPSSWVEWQNLFLGVSGGLLPLPYPVYGIDYSSVVLADQAEFQAFIGALTARRAYVVGGGTTLAQSVQQATTTAEVDAVTDGRV